MIKHTPPMKNYYTYPMIMLSGEVKELVFIKGKYFSQRGVDVSDEVEYYLVKSWRDWRSV